MTAAAGIEAQDKDAWRAAIPPRDAGHPIKLSVTCVRVTTLSGQVYTESIDAIHRLRDPLKDRVVFLLRCRSSTGRDAGTFTCESRTASHRQHPGRNMSNSNNTVRLSNQEAFA